MQMGLFMQNSQETFQGKLFNQRGCLRKSHPHEIHDSLERQSALLWTFSLSKISKKWENTKKHRKVKTVIVLKVEPKICLC